MGKRWWLIIAALIIIILAYFSYAKITGMVSMTSVNICTDSDFGLKYWTKGRVWGESYNDINAHQETYSKEDYCQNKNILIEYYCIADKHGVNQYKAEKTFVCKEGCNDGMCLGEKIEKSFIEKLKSFFFKKA